MDLSKIFNLQAESYPEIYNITSDRVLELGELITEPLVLSAYQGKNTLAAGVDFFTSLQDKNLPSNELLYLSFIAGAGYISIVKEAENFKNAKSI